MVKKKQKPVCRELLVPLSELRGSGSPLELLLGPLTPWDGSAEKKTTKTLTKQKGK